MGEKEKPQISADDFLRTMVHVDLEGSPDLQGALSRIGYKLHTITVFRVV